MEDIFKNPVQFSKGININDLMTSQAEFHLDLDFKATKHGIDLTEYGDIMLDAEDDDSEDEDVFEHVEKRVEEMLLSSPEYLSFEELAARMIDVPCRPSGAVKIMIIEEGDGELVSPEAEVSIHYAAYWEKAKLPFDTSLTVNRGNPMRIKLGDGRCLPGLEFALTSVRGPTARLIALLQPEVAWGSAGAPPRVRAEPALFVLALHSVSAPGTHCNFNSLPTEEQTKFSTTVRTVHTLSDAASDLFKQKRYNRAISRYQQAMHILSLSRAETDDETKEIANHKVKQFVNLAVCYYKLNKPRRVIDMCDSIDKLIDIETHCKALFYKGKAYQMIGDLEKSLVYCKKALKLEPNNKEIGALLAKIEATVKKGAEEEVKMWQRVFSSGEKEKEVVYHVDEEFESGVREMCQDLAVRTEFTKVELPTGLLTDEVMCLRSLVSQFDGLRLEEDGEGRRKRVAIVKTIL